MSPFVEFTTYARIVKMKLFYYYHIARKRNIIMGMNYLKWINILNGRLMRGETDEKY